MKPHKYLLWLALLGASSPALLAQSDITQPGDTIVATSNNSPGSEGVANAIDNQPTKYLNFDGANNGLTGFIVTPGVGSTIVTGLTLQSANDAPERDPATYDLQGSNDGTTFVPISSGDVPAFGDTRFKTVRIDFANASAFKSYKLTFPTTASANGCCMQVAEVELLGTVVPPDVTQPGDLIVANSNNSPGSEGVANAIDNQPTKYLNFDGANNGPTGFTVTPSVGATIVTGLTLQSANDAPERDPATYKLEGSNDGTNFVAIANGDVPAFGDTRFKTVQIFFANTKPYKSYRLTFPTTAASNGCCMQVAEVELLGTVAPQDVTQPGDLVVATSNNSPGSEGVANAIDNQPTKYLNFDGANNGLTGFIVTPSVGKTIVTGLTLQSANDAPERDPATYKLEGSNDGATYSLISAGDVPAFGDTRFKTVEIFFENATAYSSYKLTFPTTASANGCCMQVAEVEFLGFSADSGALPKFKTQPADAPTLANAPAHFFVTVNGPWQVQWYHNEVLIPGATQLSYTTTAITAANDGDRYYAIVKNGALSSQSDVAHIRLFTPSTTKSLAVNFRGQGANGAPTDLANTDVAGVHPQAYWNNAAGNTGDLPTTDTEGNPIPFTDSDNVESTITVNFTASSSWGTGTGTDNGDRKLLNGYLDPNGNANAAVITFGNVPAGKHSIIVYSVNRPLAFNDVNFSVQGQAASPTIYIRAQNADEYNAAPGWIRGSGTSAEARTVANYVRFDNVSPDASGTIVLTAQSLLEPGEVPAGTAPVNGVQLLLNAPELGNPPAITGQPASLNTVASQTATFTVTASGTTPLAYQWKHNGSNLSDGGRISGSKTSTLTIASSVEADAGNYSVTVSNAAGSANSAAAVLSFYSGEISDRLVAHWAFDETSGLVANNSVVAGQDGELKGYEGGAGWTTGRMGGALSFDGVGQYVVVPNYTKPTTAEAVSVWVNASAANQDATVIANSGVPTQDGRRLSQFELNLVGTDADLRGLITAGPNQYSAREGADKPLSLNAWHHIVLTADGTRVTLYRDGQVVGSVEYLGRITDATAECLGIGGILDNVLDVNDPSDVLCSKVLETNPGLWTGSIDDVAVWTRTLGANEVQAIYQAGQQGRNVTTIPPVIVAPPTVSAGRDANGDVIITFTGKLFEADTIQGPYTEVSTTANPYKPTVGTKKFYRSGN